MANPSTCDLSQEKAPNFDSQGLSANPFDFLGLPPTFTLSLEALDTAYRGMVRLTHPDRFTHHTGPEKVAASLWASAANEAYQKLKSPYKRAVALLERMGHGFDPQKSPDPAFLMEVMTFQDSLQDSTEAEGEALLKRLKDQVKAAEEGLAESFESQAYDKAGEILAQYKYLERLVEQGQALFKKGAAS